MSDFKISAPKGQRKNRKILGRGSGSGRGKTCGRGHKGQKSRSGGSVRPGFEGGQMPLYRRLARRGFSNEPFKITNTEISLTNIDRSFNDGETVTIEELRKRKVIKRNDKSVKILNNGTLGKKVTIKGVAISAGAKKAIEDAGGSVQENTEQEEAEKNNKQD
jgi:large subunit ribosomal protein L15